MLILTHNTKIHSVQLYKFILGNDSLDYDKEKSKEMLLDASENVLGIFWIR